MRSLRTRSRPALAAALISALVVPAGCGNDADPPVTQDRTSGGPSESSAVASVEPSATETAARPAEPIQFRYVMAASVCTPSTEPGPDAARPAPSRADCAAFDAAGCPSDPPAQVPVDETVVLCAREAGDGSTPRPAGAGDYLLGPALIVGGVSNASYGIPEGGTSYQVVIDLEGRSAAMLGRLSRTWIHDVDQFAIVVGGQVVSAPTFNSPIPGGHAAISGDFTEDDARALAEAVESGG